MTPQFNYFNTDETVYKESIADGQILRYGEKPTSKGFSLVILKLSLTKYTEKNYHITIFDVDAAVHLINEFKTTVLAILKATMRGLPRKKVKPMLRH
jgi:phosphoribosylaminoimidazolecarboxamide formyltransferase/IMP cyclohydrolase